MDAFPVAGIEEVPGFLSTDAAHLLHGLALWQRDGGIRGDVVEIGVFYGRSALVLGAALAPGERLFACDTFTTGAADVPGWSFPIDEEPEGFLRRCWDTVTGAPGALVVRRTDSAALVPGDLAPHCRVVHVDGGHAHRQVLSDARLAEEVLHPEGAVVFDDVLLPEWPDVTVAIAEHLSDGSGLVPVAVAEHKLVVCRAAARARYADWAQRALPALYRPPRHLVAERTFTRRPVLVAARLPPPPAEAVTG